MSRIDDLIAQHCPDGVYSRRLKEVARIRNGRDYKGFNVGNVPVYGTGGVMTFIDTSVYDRPSVLIPRKGSLNKLYFVDQPFWTVDTIFYTEIFDHMLPKFFFYFLQTQHLEDLNQAGGVPSLTQSVLNELTIPVPPLEVQREIVRILDTFTALEAELEAELEARTQQYGHYRDTLLTCQDGSRVLLGDLGVFIRGRRFTWSDVVDEGTPAIHYSEIYTTYGVSTAKATIRVRSELAPQLRFAAPGDVVIAAVGETVEDLAKAVAWMGDEPVAIHDDTFLFRSELNPKYVSYCLQTADFHRQKDRHVARSKVKRISSDGLAQVAIPVLPMDEQERIVATLDTFGALVNDLSVGLPAELAARRRQYEHYRDRLLTFKELGA